MDQPSFVVTGGARGVGRSIAHRLAQDGHVVVLDVIGALDWDDPSIQLVSGDARDPLVAREAAQRGEERGPLSGWVNNAAVFGDAGLASASAHDVLGLITTNLALALTGCHVAVNHYLHHNRAGAIVNVSSDATWSGGLNPCAHYAASKAGLVSITRSMAKELAGYGIRVNALAPGMIDTDMGGDAGSALGGLQIPLGRYGTPEEVAAAVVFLASSEASYVTGAVLNMSGGLFLDR